MMVHVWGGVVQRLVRALMRVEFEALGAGSLELQRFGSRTSPSRSAAAHAVERSGVSSERGHSVVSCGQFRMLVVHRGKTCPLASAAATVQLVQAMNDVGKIDLTACAMPERAMVPN